MWIELLSQIGKPLDLPQIALIELNAKNFAKAEKEVYLISEKIFNNLRKIQKEIVRGKYQLF